MDGERRLKQFAGEIRQANRMTLREGEIIRRKRQDIMSWRYPAQSVTRRIPDVQPLPMTDVRDQERLSELRDADERNESLGEEDTLGFVYNRPVFSSQGGEK